jgi:hypothetical protein
LYRKGILLQGELHRAGLRATPGILVMPIKPMDLLNSKLIGSRYGVQGLR